MVSSLFKKKEYNLGIVSGNGWNEILFISFFLFSDIENLSQSR